MSDTLVDVIQKITEKGWRVHFEGFGASGSIYFTITTKSVPFSHISGAISQYELMYCKVDALTLKLEKAYGDLKRIEENPYGRNPEAKPTETEPVHGDNGDQD